MWLRLDRQLRQLLLFVIHLEGLLIGNEKMDESQAYA